MGGEIGDLGCRGDDGPGTGPAQSSNASAREVRRTDAWAWIAVDPVLGIIAHTLPRILSPGELREARNSWGRDAGLPRDQGLNVPLLQEFVL